MAELFDYDEMSLLCKEMIEETGRSLTLYKLSAAATDPSKPWRGSGSVGPEPVNQVAAMGVFVVPQTSIPTESRGLAFDWVDQELLRRTRHVCMVYAEGLPALEDYKLIVDGELQWQILWGQCLQPGTKRLLYVFGVAQ